MSNKQMTEVDKEVLSNARWNMVLHTFFIGLIVLSIAQACGIVALTQQAMAQIQDSHNLRNINTK